jgi:2-polyprenyl-3-methyl-5-hydroxy-6-metoxy-1,4-benzoquinol methylase
VEPHDPQDAIDPSEAWKALLTEQGAYQHACSSPQDFKAIRSLGLAWRRILRVVRPPRGARMFELGCGGGKHLATLAANGYVTHGVDVSPEVVERAESYLASVRRFGDIQATAEVANFLEYAVDDQRGSYDVCFHAGVVEHFLDPAQRALIWRKMAALTKPGGAVVSLVPCGAHILRPRIREHHLVGYNVPEIDYSCDLHTREFTAAGLVHITAMAHNFFAFLPAHPSALLRGPLARPLFLAGNATLPWLPLPDTWKERYASTLLVVGRVPR